MGVLNLQRCNNPFVDLKFLEINDANFEYKSSCSLNFLPFENFALNNVRYGCLTLIFNSLFLELFSIHESLAKTTNPCKFWFGTTISFLIVS